MDAVRTDLEKHNDKIQQLVEAGMRSVVNAVNEKHENQTHQLIEAVYFAAEKHKYQTRKNKTGGSYITHPISVMRRLYAAGVKDSHVLVAAVLHDVVEDTDATIEEVAQKFGGRVAHLVAQVTDDKTLPKAERKKQQVKHAKHSSHNAFMIKMADAIDNLSDLVENPPPNWGHGRVKGYFVWKKAVMRARDNPITPVNPQLESALNALFERVIGEKDDEKQLLDAYYKSMEQCNED